MVYKFTPVFKELKIGQANAQKLVDIYAEHRKAEADLQATNFQKFLDDSKKETIEALGANYKESLAYAAKVKERFLSPETMEELNASGLSNSKNLILDLIKIGKLISEDKLIDGKGVPGAGAEKTLGQVLYPALP